MRNYFALLLLFFAATASLQAQVLTGLVRSDTGQPLPGSHVHSGGQYAVTDAQGRYHLTLPTGTHTVSTSYVGYRTQAKTITITFPTDATLDFVLVTDVSQLAEIAVHASAQPKTLQPKTQLGQETLEKYSNATLGDALREVSGVSALKTGSTVVKPVIDGLHSSRVLVVNQNVRMEDQQWGLEHAPNVDLNAAGKISVIKGAAGLQYGGDAVGGIILIEPERVPVKDTLYGKALLNTASNGRGGGVTASVTQAFKNGWYWRAQGTFKQLGDLEAPHYVLSNTGTVEQDGSASIGYKGDHSGWDAFYSYYEAKIGILRAAHIGNITDLVNAINNKQPSVVEDFTYKINAPKQEVAHHLAKLSYYRDWHGARLDVQYAFQFNNRQEFDIRRGENRFKPALDLDLSTHNLLLDYAFRLDTSLRFKTGLSATYQQNVAHLDTGIRPLIPNYDKFEAGAYGQLHWQPTEKWLLEAGLRYDFCHLDALKYYLVSRWNERGYNQDFQSSVLATYDTQLLANPTFAYHNFAGVAGAKYALAAKTDAFLNLSVTRRNPNPSELFSDGLHHATGQIELGDLRLQQETSVKISATLAHRGETLRFEASPYVNRISNFMYLQPNGLEYTIRGAFPVWEYRSTNAQLTGADLTLDWDVFKSLNYKATFAYVHAQDLDNNRPLIDMPPARWTNTLRFSREKWSGFNLGLQHEWVLYQNRFPNNDFTAQVIQNGAPQTVLVHISQPPPAYGLLHLTSEVALLQQSRTPVTLRLGINNLLNTAYRDYLNRMRFYADDMGRNITFQVKVNF